MPSENSSLVKTSCVSCGITIFHPTRGNKDFPLTIISQNVKIYEHKASNHFVMIVERAELPDKVMAHCDTALGKLLVEVVPEIKAFVKREDLEEENAHSGLS